MDPIIIHKQPPSPCDYLAHETSQYVLAFAPPAPSDYSELLMDGWRRMGRVVFRPDCPSCRKCLSLRVRVEDFHPSRTQRRIWRANAADVTLRRAAPSLTRDRVELYRAFHAHGHETKGWPDRSDEITEDGARALDILVDNPFPTEEWSYWIGERLVGVGYVDVVPEGLSAIYFFHDPSEHRRSLGTLNILHLVDTARQRGLPHVYLGYYVDGCRSLEYKARFKPSEVFGTEGWEAFRDS